MLCTYNKYTLRTYYKYIENLQVVLKIMQQQRKMLRL